MKKMTIYYIEYEGKGPITNVNWEITKGKPIEAVQKELEDKGYEVLKIKKVKD